MTEPLPERWVAGASGWSRSEGKPFSEVLHTTVGYGRSANEALGAALRALIDNGASDGLGYRYLQMTEAVSAPFGPESKAQPKREVEVEA